MEQKITSADLIEFERSRRGKNQLFFLREISNLQTFFVNEVLKMPVKRNYDSRARDGRNTHQ